MTILEAFRAGTPTVTTSSLGVADLCEQFEAALITDGSPENLAEAVESLLTDSDLVDRVQSGGFRLVREELDIAVIARKLVAAYDDARALTVRSHQRKEA